MDDTRMDGVEQTEIGSTDPVEQEEIEALRQGNIDFFVNNLVRYHVPSMEQSERIIQVREAVRFLIGTIIENVPRCADRSVAIRKAREAMMTANAGIVLDGLV